MNHVVAFVLMVVASVNTAMAADIASAPAPNAQKVVLVTGASTGIGRKITERLAKEGYFVYAGARKEQDLRDLNAIRLFAGRTPPGMRLSHDDVDYVLYVELGKDLIPRRIFRIASRDLVPMSNGRISFRSAFNRAGLDCCFHGRRIGGGPISLLLYDPPLRRRLMAGLGRSFGRPRRRRTPSTPTR